MSEIKHKRIWAMPSKYPFRIKPIQGIVRRYFTENWVDPYAGPIFDHGTRTNPCEITNDLNPAYPTTYHLDALDFLKRFPDDRFNGAVYDPPYSTRQIKECYESIGHKMTQETTQNSFWSNTKKELARIIKPGGIVISMGWNSGGLGLNLGFTIVEILLVPHGGWHNDTIVTVEYKTKNPPRHEDVEQEELF